ncbi:MAG: hypothetical protein ACRCY4_06060 [Brevinema sp.]
MIDKQFSLYNGGRYLIIGFLMLLSSCSVITENVPADLLFINSWRERRVDFNLPTDVGAVTRSFEDPNHKERRINPAIETVKEFSTAVGRDGALYIVYTTEINGSQTVTFQEGTAVDGVTRITNIFSNTLEGLSTIRSLTITSEFNRTGTLSPTYTSVSVRTNEPVPASKASETGVWVRVLRYDATSVDRWSILMASERPAPFTEPKLVFIPGRTIPYVAAVSNGNRIAVFGQSGGVTPQMEFITSPAGAVDLNGGRNPSSVRGISSFNDGDRTYVSFIEDDRNAIGYIRNLKWQDNYTARWEGRTPSVFHMTSSQGNIYGVWWNPTDQISTVASYSTNSVGSRRWLTINNISSSEFPKVKSRFYRDMGGENTATYLGYIYGSTKFFQLAAVSNSQIYTTGPPLDGFNNRYDFDIDSAGRIMYVRVGSTGSIDVATWTRSLWRTAGQPEKIVPDLDTGVNRVSYRVFPSSSVEAAFLGNDAPFVIFIEDSGNLQMIEGLKAFGS